MAPSDDLDLGAFFRSAGDKRTALSQLRCTCPAAINLLSVTSSGLQLDGDDNILSWTGARN